jgi:hypothetical protein
MSSPQRNFWIAFYALGALVFAATTALPACSQAPTPEHETQSAALTISPGVTLSSATWWLIAADGTTKTGTVAVGTTKQVAVPPSALGLAPSTSYQLVVSGVASDGITGCSGSTSFTTNATGTLPMPASVTLACASPPDAGQLLLTNTVVNSCPVIDGVSANPASAVVGATMALAVTAHDPDSGPAVLTYQWMASSGTLTGATTSTPTFSCTAPGTVTITVAPSDGDANCGVNLPFTVSCTGP